MPFHFFTFNNVPLIAKLLLGVLVGIISAFYGVNLDLQLALTVSGAIFFVLFFIVVAKKSSKYWRIFYGIASFSLYILLGTILSGLHKSNLHTHYFASKSISSNSVFQIRLLEPPEEKEKSVKCLAAVQKVDSSVVVGNVLLYFQKTPKSLALNYGDVLLLNSTFTKIQRNGNPKEFDYARYLKIHDIHHQTYVQENDWMKVGNDSNPFLKRVFKMQNILENRLDNSKLSTSNLMVAKALLLGKKESLDRDLLRTFSSAGAMHVLAVSGLHVGIIMLLFSKLFAPLKRLRKGKLVFILLLLAVIWCYAIVTGMSSSVLRATVMFTFVIIGKELERDTSVYQSILVSAFILIIFDPFVIFQVGFQLSYLAVLGIVFLQPKFYGLFYFKSALVREIWKYTTVSVAAQLATFPLGLYYFHQFPNFFFISNLIVIPGAFIILIVGICYLATWWISYVEWFLGEVLNVLITGLNLGVKWVESLPYSIYWGVSIMWFEVIWMYILLLLFSYAFVKKDQNVFKFSLVGVVLLLGFNIAEQWGQSRSNELVIYNVNNSNAIDLFYGRNNLFMADQDLLEDDEKLLFTVKHNWYYKTGEELPTYSVVLNEQSLLEFGQYKLFLLNQLWAEKETDNFYDTDVIYLNNINYLSDKMLQRMEEWGKKIVIGPHVKYSVQKRIEENFIAENVHVLKTEGAFHMSF